MYLLEKIFCSWAEENGTIESIDGILSWIRDLHGYEKISVEECSINDSTFWFYDDYNGEILNRKRSFFSIKGMRRFEDGEYSGEQPIIIQPEIGYLGIICREINGILHFLMQAKIEPGNVNTVQLSPTIQATKSNFTRAHGGQLPFYFDLFENSDHYELLYDQIQSEQGTRFYKKRNRNMIMLVDEDFEIYPNFKWMTLGQIKKLMEIDNLVNMDTRTVLSGIPLLTPNISGNRKKGLSSYFHDQSLASSLFDSDPSQEIPYVFHILNNYKMFHDVKLATVPLNQLVDWSIDEYGITCKKQADYMVRYYDIEISGRETKHWTQPLFKAIGMATFGLLSRVQNGKREYLVKLKPEIGSFDKAEIGPSVQWEPSHYLYNDNEVDKLFRLKHENRQGIMVDVVLSEEGGRFYHEQNHNVIIETDPNELGILPEDYIWVSYAALSFLVQANYCLNIQLRNLLSLIKL